MKKIVFLTGTRADYGKLKSLIEITEKSGLFNVYIFATGMHMNVKYGKTVDEIYKSGYKNIFPYYNHSDGDSMDEILANTITGFSNYVKDINPELIVLHGDRPEALAGAIVGSFNNILTAHIEGGEVSGTIDESIRHAVSKLCHIHFVSNKIAKNRLKQLGEESKSIFIIGSPDIDIMLSSKLPILEQAKAYYDIKFDKYSILMFHPVTSEYNNLPKHIANLVDAVIESKLNYIVIYPNNDRGSDFIFAEYQRLQNNLSFRIFPSIRFEYFLVFLKNASFIIGNSSAGIREAPYYSIPTINIGTRQTGRIVDSDIINCGNEKIDIFEALNKVQKIKIAHKSEFGAGRSNELFFDILKSTKIWNFNKQKFFIDQL